MLNFLFESAVSCGILGMGSFITIIFCLGATLGILIAGLANFVIDRR